jgi:hypothetical protein
MGAFLGYGDVGVWASNRERDAFLDWYAENRCAPHDPKWEYCKSEAQRWMGRCIDLDELIPRGDIFEVTDAERAGAVAQFGPTIAQLLGIIGQITRGEWRHLVSSKEAVNWREASSIRVTSPPVKWVAELTHAREVSLFGTADLSFWKEKLVRMDLRPAETDGKARLLIVSTDASFMGVRFRELSFSVLVCRREAETRRDAAFLLRAFNSCRLFALCERKLFSTPYYHADVRISAPFPPRIQLLTDGGLVFQAEMQGDAYTPVREPLRQGEEVWEGPIIIGNGAYVFFARLKGYTQTYPFLPANDSITIRPSSDTSIFQALIESDFVAKEWSVREDAAHARSKTYRRREVLRGLGG